ncbi:acyl-CoA thioesterase domain-containing protein [Cryptosporangium minutisporangium]|uniref:Thioesterase family protein n=1 Tax=Cryptosporangium minutisporangium TaxID=113569 RepID=A0ABP6T8L6_9ACTN
MTTTTAETTLVYPADETWQGFTGVHGGVVVAALLAAADALVPGTPATITTHFLAPVPPGDLLVDAALVHPGRTAAVTARIGTAVTGLVRVVRPASARPSAAPGTPPGRADAGTAGTGDTGTGAAGGVAPAWPLPDAAPEPEACPRLDLPVQLVPVGQHFEIRPVSASRPLAGGDEPAFDVWIRLRPAVFTQRAFAAPEAAAILLDALPPGLFATLRRPVPIPTAELTAHFTPVGYRPDGWFRLRQRTAWATADLCVDETELRTADGELAAQARQLRRIVR